VIAQQLNLYVLQLSLSVLQVYPAAAQAVQQARLLQWRLWLLLLVLLVLCQLW
jgi:hypothetical protein